MSTIGVLELFNAL